MQHAEIKTKSEKITMAEILQLSFVESSSTSCAGLVVFQFPSDMAVLGANCCLAVSSKLKHSALQRNYLSQKVNNSKQLYEAKVTRFTRPPSSQE